MNIFNQRSTRWSLALLAFAPLAAIQSAQAAGTASGTSISNTATVNYQVGGVSQAPIGSSPTGNTTGAGTATQFVVDTKADLTVTEVTGGPTTPTSPGQTAAVTSFRVTNTGNAPQAFTVNATNVTGGALFGNTDNTDVTNFLYAIDSNNNGTYEAGTDPAPAASVTISSVNADANVVVLVFADVPATATNGQYSNVRLTARIDENNNAGTALAETTGGDTAGVDVVFADAVGTNDSTAARDGQASNLDQYAIVSAALSIQKTSAVTEDPFNLTTNPKAIPGATVQYEITLTNTGAASATLVTITDAVPTNTTFKTGGFGGADVQIQVGANAPTTCVAEAGADTNTDGCFLTGGGVVTVGAPALGAVATGVANAVAVRFQVTIN